MQKGHSIDYTSVTKFNRLKWNGKNTKQNYLGWNKPEW